MADIDKEVEKIEQGNAWEESDKVVPVEVKRPLDKVIPVRLSADKWEELRREARELGIGPTTLARMWILERLRWHTTYHPDIMRFPGVLHPSFSSTEAAILQYVVQGFCTREISEKLGVDDQTINEFIKAITEKITANKLDRVGRAEYEIRQLGFSQFRVRSHDQLARLEFIPEEMNKAWQFREKIQAVCTECGFTYVSVDLKGYRTGAMNETLEDYTKP